MVCSSTRHCHREYKDGRIIVRTHRRNLCGQSIASVKYDLIVLERVSHGGFVSKNNKQHPQYSHSTRRPMVGHKTWTSAARDTKTTLRALVHNRYACALEFCILRPDALQ